MTPRIFISLLCCSMSLLCHAATPQWVRSVIQWVDSSEVRGTDPAYVCLVDQPFILYVKNTYAGSSTRLTLHSPQAIASTTLTGHLRTQPSAMLSLALSYRGWGVSLSQDLLHNGDTDFSYSLYSTRYGLEYRYHRAESLHGTLYGDGGLQSDTHVEFAEGSAKLSTHVFNAYYIFNRDHFSHPASTSCNTIQLRSAGSWIASFNYWHSGYTTYSYNNLLGFRRLSLSHINVGAGYAYNYVFADGSCLLHGSLTPMLNVWHRNHLYASSYDKMLSQDVAIDVMAHARFVYNFGSYLTGVQSIFNYSLSPHVGELSVGSFDWLARFFIGVRF